VAWLEELYVTPIIDTGGINTTLVTSVLERAQKNGIVRWMLEMMWATIARYHFIRGWASIDGAIAMG